MEGGAMRGLFTCGVLDVFLENGITFDGAAGPKTAQAIIDFQLIIAAEGVEIKEYGLCDEITWKELVDRRS